MTTKRNEFRTEKDSLGEVSIPSQYYWGIKTARAQANSYSCGLKMPVRLIEALVTVKKAMALVNQELGRLESGAARCIGQACDEVLAGRWREQFVIGPFQGNAGSVFDTNVNEVLANRAEELLGGEPGQYKLVKADHHINLGLVRAEVIALAMRLAVLLSLKEFEPAVLDLERLLRRKAVELAKSAKLARTASGDPSPALLELAFNSFGSAVERGLKRIKDMSQVLADVQAGNSPAITGGANLEYASRLLERLSKLTGLKLRLSEETGRSGQSVADFLHVSSSLKELAVELSKIANDLRQLEAGSHLHFLDAAAIALEGEHLPNRSSQSDQMGAAEALCVIAFQVIGNDLATALACQSGQPQLTAVSPMVVYNLLQSVDLLHQSVACFNQRFLVAITPEAERTKPSVDLGSHFFALLSEHVGLERSRQLYEEFSGSSKEISDALEQRNMVPPEVLEKLSKHHAQPEKGQPGASENHTSSEKRADDRELP
jgi:aspartate ammonia-lyase